MGAQMTTRHGWIAVDLDGTLAEHYWPHKGPYNPLVIGEPLAPMVKRVQQWLRDGYEVRVFTARVGPHGSAPGYGAEHIYNVKLAIANWTQEHVGQVLPSTCTKDYEMICIYDDRAIRVKHNIGTPCCSDSAEMLARYV